MKDLTGRSSILAPRPCDLQDAIFRSIARKGLEVLAFPGCYLGRLGPDVHLVAHVDELASRSLRLADCVELDERYIFQ